ncbi:MAG TPA: UpxY family transcription antiterminator [Bryobacteraceae bacterium]|nr:UpxY family transcription antiterminator [Bryobacteraceae bacterium]
MNSQIALDPSWFALTVQPNHERTVERGLRNRGWEAYLPVHRVRRRWSDRDKDLETIVFPGYVFCKFVRTDLIRVLSAPGVRSVVGAGRNPIPVEESEISAVRALASSGRPLLPWPYLHIGQNVLIDRGPLASIRGSVVRMKESCRVVVSVEALGCSVAVEVDPEMLVADPVFHGRN